jgi:hypothetical protein
MVSPSSLWRPAASGADEVVIGGDVALQDECGRAAIVAAAGVTNVVAFSYRLHIGAGLAALEGLRLALSVLSSHVCSPLKK